MALVVLSLPTVPGARAAVRGFKTRTLVPGLLTLACLLMAAPATAQVNYGIYGNTAYVERGCGDNIVIASTYNGYPVTSIRDFAFLHCTSLTRVTIPASVTSIGGGAFLNCTNLTNVTFLGNPPGLFFDLEIGGLTQFANVGAGAKAYYYCGTTGWRTNYGGWGTNYPGLPTVMLCPPQIAPGSAGVKPGGFGFTLTSLTHQTIVVEASTNLPNWQPIWTNTMPGASTNFVDPEWLNHSNRFYRARSN